MPKPTSSPPDSLGRESPISGFITRRQLHRLPLYQELYRPQGIEFQLGAPITSTRCRLSRVTINRHLSDFSDQQSLASVGRFAILLTIDGRTPSLEESHRCLFGRYFGSAACPDDRLPEPLHRWLAEPERQPYRTDDAGMLPEPLVIRRSDGELTLRLIPGGSERILLFEGRETSRADLLEARRGESDGRGDPAPGDPGRALPACPHVMKPP